MDVEWNTAIIKIGRSTVYNNENQGCGVGGKMSGSNSDLSKIFDSDFLKSLLPTPTYPKFPAPDSLT